MKNGIKITLGAIIKNEEDQLNQFISNIKNNVSEIIIVDTGSTDNSIQILKKHDINVFEYPITREEFDFSVARNYMMKKCSGDWVLTLDADERIYTVNFDKLKLDIANDKEINAVSASRYTYVANSLIAEILSYPKLFKKSAGFTFTNPVFERATIDENIIKYNASPLVIEHFCYDKPMNQIIQKKEFYRDIIFRMSEEDQAKFSNMRQLAQLYCDLNDYYQSTYYTNKLLGIAKNHEQEASGLILLGSIYYKYSKYKEALAAYKKAASILPLKRFIHNKIGLVFERMKEYQEALSSFTTSIQDSGDDMPHLHYNLGITYLKLKEYNKASSEIIKAFSLLPRFMNRQPNRYPGYVERFMHRIDTIIDNDSVCSQHKWDRSGY